MAELDYQYISTLVSRARTGDSDSFAELYAATYQKEYRFAYHYLKDEYLAQDALQETYILALKNLYMLKDSKLFVSWLNQINFRVCFNMHLKQNRYDLELSSYGRRNEQEHLGFSGHEYRNGQEHLGLSGNPEDMVVKVDEQEYIMNKILELSPSESQAILMKYYQDMKLEEIAKVMGVSRSTVKRCLSSGKAKLGVSIKR